MKGKHPFKLPMATSPIGSPRDLISALPTELALRCLRYLPAPSLVAAARTCRRWQVLCSDQTLWYRLCRKHNYLPRILERYPHSTLTHAGLVEHAHLAPMGEAASPNPTRHHRRAALRLAEYLNHYAPPLTSASRAVVNWGREFQYYYTLGTNWLRGKYESRDFRGHTDVILAVRIDPARRLVFSGSSDHVVKVWSLDTHRCTRTLTGHTAAVSCLDYDPRTGVLVTGSWDGTAQVWTTTLDPIPHTATNFKTPGTVPLAALPGLTADTLAHLNGQATPVGPAPVAGRPVFTRRHVLDHGEEVICLRSKGDEIVVGTGSGLVQLWDAVTGTCRAIYNMHSATASGAGAHDPDSVVGCVDFNAEFIYVGIGSSVAVFDRRTERVLAYIGNHSSSVTALKLDAGHLVSGAEDSSLLVWHHDPAPTVPTPTPAAPFPFSRVEPQMLHGHLSGVRCLQTHGDRLCTGSYDTTIRVWSVGRDREGCILKLKGHIGDVNAIDMTDSLIVSGSDDGVVKVWDFGLPGTLPPPYLVDAAGYLHQPRGRSTNSSGRTATAGSGGNGTGGNGGGPSNSPSRRRRWDDSGSTSSSPAKRRSRGPSSSPPGGSGATGGAIPSASLASRAASKTVPTPTTVATSTSHTMAPLTWLDACTQILAATPEPLSCQTVYDRIQKASFASLFLNRGRTPLNTLSKTLHSHARGPRARFCLIAGPVSNRFTLNPGFRRKLRDAMPH